jgi:hypothetical protein
MYIPDEQWDEIVSDALEMSDHRYNILPCVQELFNRIINLEDSPVPRKKRATLKGFHKIKKGRLIMRKFTKYFIVRLVGEQINKLKKLKRTSKCSIKSE